MKTDTTHGVASACKDCGGWVLFDTYGEVIETWPDGWEDNVCRNFLIAQGVQISGDPAPPPQPMPTQPASYGEPWSKASYNAPLGDSGDYEGVIEIYTRDNAMRVAEMWNPEDENELAFDRAIACVNACQGIADPEKAIQTAREALQSCFNAMDKGESLYADYDAATVLLGNLRSALAQLNGRAGE